MAEHRSGERLREAAAAGDVLHGRVARLASFLNQAADAHDHDEQQDGDARDRRERR